MSTTIDIRPGLYRSTRPYPGREEELPADALLYVGRPNNGGFPFVVRPHRNRNNRWFWREPTFPLDDPAWAKTLFALRNEGFYTLPRTLKLDGGGRWIENAIVQLGYNRRGRPILFVGEHHDREPRNVLVFSDRGVSIDDTLLAELRWAPILPVKDKEKPDETPPYLN